MFDQIEKKKREYTDKYVVVDATRPELARFRDVVGHVKTVNMSGRALVEFDDYHLNIGWYDIDPEFLKVVDKPPPKAAKPEAKKAGGEGRSEAGRAAKTPAAKAPAAGAKPGKAIGRRYPGGGPRRQGRGEAAPARPRRPEAAARRRQSRQPLRKPAEVDRSKMSVADMLAAARAGGAGSCAGEAAGSAAPAAKTQAAAAP